MYQRTSPTSLIHDDHRVWRRLQQSTEGLLSLLSLCDVADRADRQDAVFRLQWAQTDLDGELGSVLATRDVSADEHTYTRCVSAPVSESVYAAVHARAALAGISGAELLRRVLRDWLRERSHIE